MAKAQVFQQDFEAVDAKAVGYRRIDIERFPGDTLALVRAHCVERLHVVQPVGKFDEDDANVFDHREHHLAEALGLGFGTAAELDLVELADAVDYLRDFFAELLLMSYRSLSTFFKAPCPS